MSKKKGDTFLENINGKMGSKFVVESKFFNS